MDGLLDFGKQIVAAAVGSGVVFGLFKMFWEQRKEQGHRKERERHLALLIAQHLETFAITTADKLADDMTFAESEGSQGNHMPAHPKIGAPPASTDYQLMDSGLVDRLYALPLDCETTSSSVTSAFEVLDGDDAYDVKHHSFLELLQRAFSLAADYRKRYGLTARPKVKDAVWDQEKWVRDELAKIEESRAKVRERNAGWADVTSSTS